jgi:phosphatidylserine/phosphatidylglycerophosphate/cardiolipin synthase-like enzyme
MRFALPLALTALAWTLSGPVEAGSLTPCFTPGQDCTSAIVAEIGSAKSSLLVQAYSFTSTPIIEAIAGAKQRGVDVRVILDASNDTDKYNGATYLLNHGIQPLIDYKPAIAHNKVMVIDGRDVITGSFNFTKAAQSNNAENVLFVRDEPALAKSYIDNWQKRAAASRPYNGPQGKQAAKF